MNLSNQKIESLKKIRDKSGHNIYEFSTSWWAIWFFIFLVGGCVLWNTFIPYQLLRFDPYPYNGLRVALNLVGAIQAPLLLLYSKKSTDYRKRLLEKDYELEKKILKKLDNLEKELLKTKINYNNSQSSVDIPTAKPIAVTTEEHHI